MRTRRQSRQRTIQLEPLEVSALALSHAGLPSSGPADVPHHDSPGGPPAQISGTNGQGGQSSGDMNPNRGPGPNSGPGQINNPNPNRGPGPNNGPGQDQNDVADNDADDAADDAADLLGNHGDGGRH